MIQSREVLVFWAIMTVICLCALATLTAAVLTLWLVLKSRITSTRAGKTFCGHCGEPVSETPTSAIALTDKAFLVYTCKRCQTDTLLPRVS